MRVGEGAAVLRVAATYAGSMIGAGFASGQEMLQFFVSYGAWGIGGIALAGFLFSWLGVRILNLGFDLSARSFPPLLHRVCGQRLGRLLEYLTIVFLFGVLTIMLAGAGTVFRDYFGLTYQMGLAFLAVLSAITVVAGIRGIAVANSIVTPTLIICTLLVGGYSLSYHAFDFSGMSFIPQPDFMPAPHWVLAALLYVSYNLVVCATVLAPLGAATPSRRVRVWGGIIGGLLLAALAAVVCTIIFMHTPGISLQEVPMLYISSIQHEFNLTLYAVTLLAAMYTTAIACLYGCAQKLRDTLRVPLTLSGAAITTLAAYCSQFGFAGLIAFLFPIFGYAALWFTFRLACQPFRGNLSRLRPPRGLRR